MATRSSGNGSLPPWVGGPARGWGADGLDSDSDSSQRTKLSYARRSPYVLSPQAPNSRSPALGPVDTAAGPLPRPPPIRPVHDPSSRNNSPTQLSPAGSFLGHRPRQRSQGYFEPALPSNSTNANMAGGLSASQIAAQTAMHVQQGQHNRKRSTTIPEPGAATGNTRRPPVSPPPVPSIPQTLSTSNVGVPYQNGTVGGHRIAAASAANAAFPRSPLNSPQTGAQGAEYPTGSGVEKEQKKSKMKLFSKPKSIATSKDKDFDRKHPPLPSPNKMSMQSTSTLNRMMMNSSTTSLVDPTMSSASSIYSTNNASTSTLVPTDRGTGTYAPAPEKEKEKHKHHFLSRQKNKLRDKDDHYGLSLSSANSTSKPTDPNAPQPLYSFAAPVSPGHSSTFGVSGLDLRHGGRALRQKKKEEKAAAMAPYMPDHTHDQPFRERNQSFSTMDRTEWAGAQASAGPMTNSSAGGGNNTTPGAHSLGDLASIGATFGLQGLAPDDAWPLLKARLLHIFEGEDPRPPVEDFNGLLSIHIRRCIQKRAPTVLIEDLTDLLQTGFRSLDQTLRNLPDDRLIPALVDMWLVVFTTILPFLQAVFLPLDLEFKGRGPLMTAREAADFWGAAMPGEEQVFGAAVSTVGDSVQMSTAGRTSEDRPLAISNIPTLGEELSVRRITLLTFRDTVILPRTDALTAIFSRLSLENLNAMAAPESTSSPRPSLEGLQHPPRPGTSHSASLSADVGQGSFNSQASTLLDSTGTMSLGARSRATSNTSAGSFSSLPGRTLVPNNLNSNALPHTPGSNSGSFSHPRPSPAMQQQSGIGHPQSTYSYGYGAVAASPYYNAPHSAQAHLDSSRVTETAGRMLQCVSVLASVQSGDDSQAVMERLMRELKYNWLGRGRTGRQRRGWVGVRRPRGDIGAVGGAGGGEQQQQVAAG